jgi:hypothetical protein
MDMKPMPEEPNMSDEEAARKLVHFFYVSKET